jgi:hypothetical protein
LKNTSFSPKNTDLALFLVRKNLDLKIWKNGGTEKEINGNYVEFFLKIFLKNDNKW